MMFQSTEMNGSPERMLVRLRRGLFSFCFQTEGGWLPPGWSEKALGSRRKGRKRKGLQDEKQGVSPTALYCVFLTLAAIIKCIHRK